MLFQLFLSHTFDFPSNNFLLFVSGFFFFSHNLLSLPIILTFNLIIGAFCHTTTSTAPLTEEDSIHVTDERKNYNYETKQVKIIKSKVKIMGKDKNYET